MSTLQITLSKAQKAYKNANKEGKALLTDLLGTEFVNTNIMDQLNTFDDILAYHGMTQNQFDNIHGALSPDTYAYEQVKLIVLAYNEGETVKLQDTGYYPYFIKKASGRGLALIGVGYVISNAGVGPRLWYKRSDLAKDAGTKFESIYIDFFTK